MLANNILHENMCDVHVLFEWDDAKKGRRWLKNGSNVQEINKPRKSDENKKKNK